MFLSEDETINLHVAHHTDIRGSAELFSFWSTRRAEWAPTAGPLDRAELTLQGLDAPGHAGGGFFDDRSLMTGKRGAAIGGDKQAKSNRGTGTF